MPKEAAKASSGVFVTGSLPWFKAEGRLDLEHFGIAGKKRNKLEIPRCDVIKSGPKYHTFMLTRERLSVEDLRRKATEFGCWPAGLEQLELARRHLSENQKCRSISLDIFRKHRTARGQFRAYKALDEFVVCSLGEIIVDGGQELFPVFIQDEMGLSRCQLVAPEEVHPAWLFLVSPLHLHLKAKGEMVA